MQYKIKDKKNLGNTYFGKLVYNDDGDYEIHLEDGCIFNLSKALRTVYYHQENNHINIEIMNGNKVLFNEDGVLYKMRDQHQLYSYFISSTNLEEVLFFNTNENIEVTLFAEALEEKRHGANNKS